MTPIIHIHYSEYLDGVFDAYVRSIPAYKDWIRPDVQTVKDKAVTFSKAWDKAGPQILQCMCQNTGLEFKRNYFPVYVVCGNTRAYSNPIVIKSRFTADEFIECLTHELIHCLFVDNKDSAFVRATNGFADHVVLYAVMEYLLPGTVDKVVDMEAFPGNARYIKAMKQVKEAGFRSILEKCRGTATESCAK